MRPSDDFLEETAFFLQIATSDHSLKGGSPAPFAFTEGARILGEIKGLEPLEIRLPDRRLYDDDITKAKSLIGYRPQGDLEAMTASAKAFEDGTMDYRWS